MLKPKADSSRQDPVTGLLSEPRRRKILDWIQEEGSARVRELAVAFQVSEATIRQDLERLEQELAHMQAHQTPRRTGAGQKPRH